MATEYVQFAGAMVLFAGILFGSYWFVYVPRGRDGGGAGNTSAPSVRREDER